MKAKSRQSGLTLTEMTVVIVAVALLTSLGLPAIRTFFDSMATSGGTRNMISAALASARAIAAKEQRYAGIRFQEDLYGHQYMIFIVNEEPQKMDGLTIGFRAVEGLQPIKLPENLGVMDLIVRTDIGTPSNSNDQPIVESDLDVSFRITDTTSFSIIFSPSGKMVIHEVRVRNRDGDYRPVNLNDSMDDIFNSPENIIDNRTGMFIQDDYAELGLGAESSRNSFVIYDKLDFNKMNEVERYDYLYNLETIYINPYTGTMIER